MTNVQDPVIDTSASESEVTAAVVIVTMLVFLVVLNIILYIIIHKKMTKCLSRIKRNIPKKKLKIPKVTVMTVKPIKSHQNKNGLIHENNDKYLEISEIESLPEMMGSDRQMLQPNGDISPENWGMYEGPFQDNNVVQIHNGYTPIPQMKVNGGEVSSHLNLVPPCADHENVSQTGTIGGVKKSHDKLQNDSDGPQGKTKDPLPTDSQLEPSVTNNTMETSTKVSDGINGQERNDFLNTGRTGAPAKENHQMIDMMTTSNPFLQELPLKELQHYVSEDTKDSNHVTCEHNV